MQRTRRASRSREWRRCWRIGGLFRTSRPKTTRPAQTPRKGMLIKESGDGIGRLCPSIPFRARAPGMTRIAHLQQRKKRLSRMTIRNNASKHQTIHAIFSKFLEEHKVDIQGLHSRSILNSLVKFDKKL